MSRRIVALGMLTVFMSVSLPAKAMAAVPVGFQSGSWRGEVFETSNSVSFLPGTGATATSLSFFELDVSDEGRVEGTLTMKAEGSGTGPDGLRAVTTGRGTAKLSGTSTNVLVKGSFTYTVTVIGTGVSFSNTLPIDSELVITQAMCSRVSGYFGTKESRFLAYRARNLYGELSAGTKLGKVTGPVIHDLTEAIKGHPSPQELLAFVARIEEARSAMTYYGACLQWRTDDADDDIFLYLVQRLLKKSMELSDSYSAQEMLMFLGVAARMGAVGPSAPFPKQAGPLLEGFEGILLGKLEEAIEADDVTTILDLLVGAQQAGLTDLADQAQEALAP